ncbi:MAG: hypothetical protein JJ969_02325 [Rhizobiaceae bacterium]|nr:hypothetical protein [Rhizobiaceae bacterium]
MQGHTGNQDQDKSAVTDAVSMKLRRYYATVMEEAIPDRFLDLLEQLDAADNEQRGKGVPKGAADDK